VAGRTARRQLVHAERIRDAVSGAAPGRPSRSAWATTRAWLPWLVAGGILMGLAARLPRREIAHAVAAGPFWTIGLYSVVVVALALLADAWATRVAFAATGVLCPWRGVLLARGATYLLGLLNTVAGQGGMGVYLHRAGLPPLRSTGTVLFLIGAQLAALAAVGTAGALASGLLGSSGAAGGAADLGASMHAAPLLAALAAAFALYLLVVAWKPPFLARRDVLAPAFAAGGGGFLRATAARLPHMLVMIIGLWLALRLWGVALPFGRGLAVVSFVVLVMVVPVSPSGIGTMELAVVELAAPYSALAGAPGVASLAAAKANVLACALVYHLGSVVAQALAGLICLGLLARQRAAGDCTVLPLTAAAASGAAANG
jgi:hypothetical protein